MNAAPAALDLLGVGALLDFGITRCPAEKRKP
jgi:hypothetical protein